MSTTTALRFCCTEYMEWPAPEVGNSNYKGKPTPVCSEQFDTFAERAAHYQAVHADFLKACSARHRQFMLTGDVPAFVAPEVKAITPSTSIVDPDRNGSQARLPLGRPKSNKPSPEQLALIASLGKQKGQETREVKTGAEASGEIERLMMFPDRGLKPNRYSGQCSECHNPVAAEAGFVRKLDDKWITAHLPGECPEAAAPPVHVADGRYAVEAEAGHLSFYKVTNGRKPGVVFVDLLLGGGGGGGFKQQKVPFQNVAAVLAKIALDPITAALTFGKETGVCCACGRGLTNETSRQMGIGPECASKG